MTGHIEDDVASSYNGLEMLFKQFTETFVLNSIMESKHGQVRLQKEAKKGFVKSSLKIQLDIIIDQ